MLRDQLADARAEWARGEAGALEVAVLAGLLARARPDDDALSGWTLDVPVDALKEAAEEAADGVMAVDEDDDPAESWDALCSLDEVCAASLWLRRPAAAGPAVEQVLGVLRAFPEPWRLHAARATELLRTQPPAASDPARLLWAAVEASTWEEHRRDTEPGAPLSVKERLGLPVVVSLAPISAETRLAAASALPDAPPWTTLAQESGWELAVTVDERGVPVLLLAGEGLATFHLGGVSVEPVATPDGLVCPATPGDWRVEVGARTVAFRLAP